MPSSSGEEVYRSEKCTLLLCHYISYLTGGLIIWLCKVKIIYTSSSKEHLMKTTLPLVSLGMPQKKIFKIRKCILDKDIFGFFLLSLRMMRPFIWSNANTSWLTLFLLFWRVYFSEVSITAWLTFGSGEPELNCKVKVFTATTTMCRGMLEMSVWIHSERKR